MPPYRTLLLRLGERTWFSKFSQAVLVPIDRQLWQRTNGRLSLGHVGRREAALQTLLLTTTGAKTGKQRSTPVVYLEDDDAIVVVASNFGEQRHPAWSYNLIAEPRATVQVHEQRRKVRARRATEHEKAALWPRLLELYPPWDAYTHRTERDFRAFFLEPAT